MANNTLNTRLVICNDTTANWGTSEKVLLKGEYAIEFPESGEPKVKVGNGTDKFADLPYLTNTPTEITNAINAAIKAASSHTHDDRYYTESEINTKLGDLSSLSSYGSDVTSILKAIIAKLPETYSGSYSVTPSATAQSLSTSGKVMKQNVSVSAIPYKEESNSSGTTVTIG